LELATQRRLRIRQTSPPLPKPAHPDFRIHEFR
jgi:hypothetical protein